MKELPICCVGKPTLKDGVYTYRCGHTYTVVCTLVDEQVATPKKPVAAVKLAKAARRRA